MSERLLVSFTAREPTNDTAGHLSRDAARARATSTVDLKLVGPLDLNARSTVLDAAAALASSPCSEVVVDLAGVDFIDCAGLAALEVMHRDLAEHGVPMVCAEPSAAMRRLLKWLPAPPRLTFASPAAD